MNNTIAKKALVAPLLLTAFIFVGCAGAKTGKDYRKDRRSAKGESFPAIRGELQGKTKGEVVFTESPKGSGVIMILNATGLPNAGYYASHIHQTPECKGDFTSAGGHFNPTGAQHGHPKKREFHVGDLGNFRADSTGTIAKKKRFAHLSLNPEDDNYIGDRALIIHAKADDFVSQPTGAAGGRLGCAVLKTSK